MKIMKWMVLPAALWLFFFYSAANAAIPTVKASSVSFADTDLYRAKIGGTIKIGKASNESNITSYVIRWGLAGGCSAANSYIGEVAKTGANLTFQLPAGTTIPGAVYEILVYTKNSSGEMLTCQSTRTTIKDVIASKPVNLPRKVKFMSTPPSNPKNLTEPYIAESVEIYAPSNVSDITHYAIYWGDAAGNRLGGTVAPLLGRVAATKDGSITRFNFASGLTVESGGIYVIVCPENYGEQWCGPLTTTNKSNLGKTRPADLLGMNSDLSHVKSLLSSASDSTCNGFSLVSTCGDKVCNGSETATTCPSDCSTYNLASYNYQTICSSVQTVYHPVSVAEIQTLVRNAVAQGKHIKVSGAKHSATDVMCGDGIVIAMDKINMSTAGMSTNLETFEGKSVVNVPAGTLMYDLGAWLHARSKSLGYVSIGYAYPTVVGLVGTGSHGSSPTHANVLAHRVVSMNIVGPDGLLKTYSEGTTGVSDPDLWKAMKVNLGYFGVITSVRLEVQNDTNVHVRVSEHTESEFFDQNPGNFFDEISYCDFGQLNWFPATGKILKTCGLETTEAAEAGAHNMLLTPILSSDLTVPESKQAFQLAGCHPDGNDAGATMERLNYNSLLLFPPFVKTISGQTRRTMDVVGPQYQMITSPLIDTGMAFFQMDWEVAVPAQNMQPALLYVRNFLHGQNNKSRNISLPLVGVFTRFSKSEDKTLMAYTGAGGPFQDGTHVVHIEMPIYVPIGLTPSALSDYMAPYEEVVTRLITDFGARAHPAKNRQWSFDLEKQLGSYNYDNRFQRFSSRVGQFDPTGVFANPFAKRLGIVYPNFSYPAAW